MSLITEFSYFRVFKVITFDISNSIHYRALLSIFVHWDWQAKNIFGI
jgi:hypothetical protein